MLKSTPVPASQETHEALKQMAMQQQQHHAGMQAMTAACAGLKACNYDQDEVISKRKVSHGKSTMCVVMVWSICSMRCTCQMMSNTSAFGCMQAEVEVLQHKNAELVQQLTTQQQTLCESTHPS